MSDFKAHDLYKKNNTQANDRSDDFKLDHDHEKLNKMIAFFAIITLIVTAVILFAIPTIFNNVEGQFVSRGINLIIDGPSEAVAGTNVNYKVAVTNNEVVAIKDVYVQINYGSKFSFVSSNPVIVSSAESGTWFLDSLDSGETKIIDLLGVFSGDSEAVNTFIALASYEPSNFNSKFTKQTRITTKILTNAYIDLAIIGPRQVLLKDKITYEIVYKNLFTESIKEVEILVDPGEKFNIDTKEPQATNDNLWAISNIKSKSASSIKITGMFKTIGDNEITVNAKIKDKDNVVIEKFIRLQIKVVDGRLKLDLILNGSNEGGAVNIGDVLNYSVVYQNQDVLPMEDVKVIVSLSPDVLIDWSSFKSDIKPKIENNRIIWSKDEIPNLALLTPNTSYIIDFQVKIHNFTELVNIVDYRLSSMAMAEIAKIGDSVLNSSIQTKEIYSLLNTDVAFNTYVRYFNDDNLAVGSGPIPPKVDQATTYKIFVTASTTLHEIENVRIAAKVPEYVSWQNKYNISAGSLYYDTSSSTFYWNINKMLPGVNVTAYFEVSVTPSKKDINKILALLGNMQFTGIDKITFSKIEKTHDPLTTFLDTDPVMRGRGVVTE